MHGESILIGRYCRYKSPGQTLANDVKRKKEDKKTMNDNKCFFE